MFFNIKFKDITNNELITVLKYGLVSKLKFNFIETILFLKKYSEIHIYKNEYIIEYYDILISLGENYSSVIYSENLKKRLDNIYKK